VTDLRHNKHINITSRWANIQIYTKDQAALVPGAQQIVKSSDNTLKNMKNSPILNTKIGGNYFQD